MHAAVIAGLATIPAIVRELSDDDAVIAMVDANIQVEATHIIVTSGFFAYCWKNYKWYNVCKYDKRMSPVMRPLSEKSVLF